MSKPRISRPGYHSHRSGILSLTVCICTYEIFLYEIRPLYYICKTLLQFNIDLRQSTTLCMLYIAYTYFLLIV